MISETEFSLLLEKYQKEILTDEERDMLLQLVSDGEFSQLLKDRIFADLEKPVASGKWSKQMEDNVLSQIFSIVKKDEKRSFYFLLRRVIAAAAILILVVGVSYLIWFKVPVSNKPMISQVTKKDIAPGKDGAVLTLSNGQQIVLDNAANGQLAIQGNVAVTKENGQLLYENKQASTEKTVVYNTLSTPRGRQFELTLPDGTSVWLNAGSSITYPTSFSGQTRSVTTTGEVYFEVAKNPAQPFHVTVRDIDITVLGTHFNINAYDNEGSIKTTLLEGSVKISKGGQASLLKPGQQAIVSNANNTITINDDADTELTMAWKNGFTSFKSADLKMIMRQVERWYDVDVSFEGNIPVRTFTADVARTAPVSEILKILEESKIHYRIEGKKIIIIP